MSDFEKLVEPHRSELRLHCYRMLGSSCDADDMVQETLTRAFRAQETLRDRALARAWLYRIATNVCLDELAKRPRRALGPELGPPSDPELPPPPATPDEEWLEPCPSDWLVPSDPAAQYSAKESIALAFVAALQVLTPPQRAVLLLRDVVGLSADEAAAVLESSVAAVNSTLHRARIALEARVGPRKSWSPDANAPVDRDLLRRYLSAWESGDLKAVIALLHAEASFSMPPVPAWLLGRDAIARFLANRFCQTLHAPVFRTRIAGANGQPAIAFYRLQANGNVAELFALHLVTERDGLLGHADHIMSAKARAAFVQRGLPTSIPV
jgi:RNA polymerase sigma-70 factor (ECF subfamily)